MPSVRLPSPLAPYADGRTRVDVAEDVESVGAALEDLFTRHPALRLRVLDEQGALRPHVNVFVGAESIRFARGLDTPVVGASEIVILPAISGG
jgi:molybdopterin converting factor small subunit